MHVSIVSCAYRLCTLNVVSVHQPGDIPNGLCTSTKLHRPTRGRNHEVVHSSLMVSMQWLIDIIPCLCTVARRLQPMEGNIRQGPHASNVGCLNHFGNIVMAWKFIQGDIVQRQKRSTKVFTYLKWLVCILQTLSDYVMQNHQRNVYTTYGVCQWLSNIDIGQW